MPETDFIMRKDDFRSFVEELLSYNVTVIPRLRYRKPEVFELTKVDDVLDVAYNYDNAAPMAVVSSDFTVEPLKMTSFFWEWAQETRYDIHQRRGGPCLDLDSPSENWDHSPPLILDGFLVYYPTYYLSDGNEISAPAPLKELYKSLAKWIRAHCVRFSTGKRTFWLGHQAFEECRQGVITTNIEGVVDFAQSADGPER